MPKAQYLNKTFQIILERFIATGQAPNYTEIADDLGLSALEGRKLLRKLFSPLSNVVCRPACLPSTHRSLYTRMLPLAYMFCPETTPVCSGEKAQS